MKIDTTTAPAGAPEAPATEPEVEVPQQPTADAPETPPAPAAAPPTGESLEQAEQRIKAAQQKMHEATSSAAELKKENAELRATLSRIFQDPQYRPVQDAPPPTSPAAGIPPEFKRKAWQEYQSVAPEKEEEAFGLLLEKAAEGGADIAIQRFRGETQKDAITRTNREKAQQQATQLKTAITAQVQKLAPDVDLELFWDWGSRIAQQEALAETFPDVVAMVDWQVNRAIELVRKKTGTTARRGPTPEPEVTALRQSATRVTPSGSLTPRGGGEPTARPRTMVEQVNALRDKHVGAG